MIGLSDKFDLVDKKKYVLDHVEEKINQGHFSEALKSLYDRLNHIRTHSSIEEWKEFITQYRAHPISDFFLQEPLTRRAFEKPRGYAGDPIMMDFIYNRGEGMQPYSEDPSEISKLLSYEFHRLSHACHAVRERKRILSRKINQTSERVANAAILSIACGHLREAEGISAIKQQRIGKFVAIDQDKESLSVVKDIIKDCGEVIPASIMDILQDRVSLPKFDLIYTAGLYDYLPDKAAKKLTSKLFSLLNPGGRLVIANYLPDIPTCGYLEALMDWWLVYRDKDQMKELVEQIPQEEIHDMDLFVEENQVIIFIEIEKVNGANV